MLKLLIGVIIILGLMVTYSVISYKKCVYDKTTYLVYESKITKNC